MKKLLSILMALSMLLALAACGGSAEPDPNAGLYVGDTVVAYGITLNAADYFGDDFSLELQSGGKAVLHYDGDTQRLKWSLDGTAFHAEGGGESLDGTLADGAIVIPNMLDTGMSVTFVNRDYEAPAPVALPGVESKGEAETEPEAEPETAAEPEAEPETETAAEPEPEPETASAYAWWEGKWYGWGVFYLADGIFAEYEDVAWDAVADITVDGDKGTFTIYDISDLDAPELTAEVRFEGGKTDAGKMVCVKGGFLEDAFTFEEGDWEVDPADEEEGDLEHTFLFTFVCEEGDNSFRVCYVLRPWGMLWDDVREADTTGMLYDDMMPLQYEDWYLPQLEGDEASAARPLDPADKEGATGEVDMETLRSALPWLKTERNYSTTYDEVAALFGVHGQQIESVFEGKTIYRWWSGDEAYIQVTFDLHEDGSETWNVTQYDGLD